MPETPLDTGAHWPPPPWLPVDGDGDGWEPPEDCDDDDPGVNPAATEVPYNGIDEDCQDGDLVDVDGDGHIGEEVGGDDCADANVSIHPDAEEACGDSRDNNCNGAVDEGCTTKDITDPGGMAWTCAHAGTPVLGALLPVVLLVLVRRRLLAVGS